MFNIGEYLNKFKKISENRDFLRGVVIEGIKNVCGIDLDPQKIEVKNGIVKINEKPIIKSEIFLKKTKILEFFKTKTVKIHEII